MRSRSSRVIFEAVVGGIIVALATPAHAEPESNGLVLWLDAGDESTLTFDPVGSVSRWADKSGRNHHAEQPKSDAQPRCMSRAIGDRSVLRFDGNDFLNLGQADSLGFAPGDPFTIAVAFRAASNKYGTFISKGGGTVGQRSYQFYAAPERWGAITYGTRRENRMQRQARRAHVGMLVCDGSKATVYDGRRLSFSAAVENGSSNADVLIGCRRKNADNTGIMYPLTGDIAEIFVYNRALTDAERSRLHDYLARKYSAAGDLASAKTPEALAERLWRLAEENQLTDALASKAAELVSHEDPFVRAMAEWAISLKVGNDNNGQDIIWPNPQPPQWYRTWSGLSPEIYVELDWARQALSAGLDQDSKRLLTSVDAMIERAQRMTADFGRGGDVVDSLASIRRRLTERIQTVPDDRTFHRRLWLEARRVLRHFVLANPAIDFDRVVFVKHFAQHTTRNITRTFPWQRKPAGDLCILELDRARSPKVMARSGVVARSGGHATTQDSPGQVTDLLQGQLGPGHVRRFDLWWDADRVVFAFARQGHWPPEADTTHYASEGGSAWKLRQAHEPLRLYEVGLDGTGLEPLTAVAARSVAAR